MIRKDKEALLYELKSLGWLEEPTDPGRLRAPAHLMQRMAGRTFNLYEADILQQIVFSLEEGVLVAGQPKSLKRR